MQSQTFSSGPTEIKWQKGDSPEQDKLKILPHKGKGMVRWHGTVSTDLAKQNVLMPREDPASDSDSPLLPNPIRKKKSFGQKMKSVLGKVVATKSNEAKQAKIPWPDTGRESRNDLQVPPSQIRLPKIMKHLPLPREIPKNGASGTSHPAFQLKSERVTTKNVTVRSRRLSRRVSVTSVPSGLHKVDDLIETVTEKSTKLLAQRHEELRKCESLGDGILQSSKQFQRVSKKNTRKYRFRNACFPCICCC
ncbi:hypothetical protein GDO86_007088 [Hymenochirus boettgeri]|uniref:Uncharacterized protein n=1 Tax=Hymenochirus boettgeri TaxID=247094 RepID=A0A8T2IW00_9PIPI|nr:hypothetical protein GDO86_007088 [Hymenochirus boettgeri]